MVTVYFGAKGDQRVRNSIILVLKHTILQWIKQIAKKEAVLFVFSWHEFTCSSFVPTFYPLQHLWTEHAEEHLNLCAASKYWQLKVNHCVSGSILFSAQWMKRFISAPSPTFSLGIILSFFQRRNLPQPEVKRLTRSDDPLLTTK